jgi:hypothetical protein
MKISLSLSFFILALGCFFGWRLNERLVGVRETRRAVTAAVRAHGFSPEEIITSGKPLFYSKREREKSVDKTAEAKALSSEWIAWKKAQKTASQNDNQTLAYQLSDKLANLEKSQIKTVLEEPRLSSEIDEAERKQLIQLSLLILGEEYPEAALSFFTKPTDTAKMGMLGGAVISRCLVRWSEDDPLGALDWLRNNGKSNPDLLTDRFKSALISGVAKGDPSQALNLIDELAIEDADSVIPNIVQGAETDNARTALLKALRDYNGKHDRVRKDTLGRLARSLAQGDPEASQAWIASAKLNNEEIQLVKMASIFMETRITRANGSCGWPTSFLRTSWPLKLIL